MAVFAKSSSYVRARLDDVDKALAAAERDLADAALDSELKGDDRADAASAEIARLQVRRRSLEAALRGAVARERVAEHEEGPPRASGTSQGTTCPLARVERHGREVQDALAALIGAWKKLSAAADSARTMVPDALQHQHAFAGLSERHLGDMVARELARVGQRSTRLGNEPVLPALVPPLGLGETPEQVPPLDAALAEQSRYLASNFARIVLGLDHETAPTTSN